MSLFIPVFTDRQGRLIRQTLGEVLAFSKMAVRQIQYLEGKLANHISFGIVSLFFPCLEGNHKQ